MIASLSAHTEEIARLGARIAAAGKGTGPAYAAALNRVGAMTRTGMVRAMVGQTGLKRKVIDKALRKTTASPGSLTYMVRSAGGDISLKYFGARETRRGVSAAPFGHRQLFAGTFIKGGRFPARKTAKGLNGHVYRRTGKGRGPLRLVKSGVIIPREMVIDDTRAIFFRTVQANLPGRLLHELGRRLAS